MMMSGDKLSDESRELDSENAPFTADLLCTEATCIARYLYSRPELLVKIIQKSEELLAMGIDLAGKTPTNQRKRTEMNAGKKIVIVPGSTRRNSLNACFAAHLKALAEESGATVLMVNPASIELPIYDGDLEASEGVPPAALELKSDFHAADALVFVSPEYNGSISPFLKNLLDWVSRPANGKYTSLVPFRDKPVALFAAGPGSLGGVGGLRHLREIMGSMKAFVIPQDYALANASHDLLMQPTLPAPVAEKCRLVLSRLLALTNQAAA